MSSIASPIDLSLTPASPSPATTPISAPSRRQSCDRCHSQKLRCTPHGGSRTGACSRCFRHGTQCVYSLSRPKGRPSLHRYKGEAALVSPRERRETVVQPLTPEEEGSHTDIPDPSAYPYASGAMGSNCTHSDPGMATGPCLELMAEAWSAHAFQPDIYSCVTMHAQSQTIDVSTLMYNTPIDMDLGFHDALSDLYMHELQEHGQSVVANDHLQSIQQSPCTVNRAISSLSQLIPRLHTLSKNSHEQHTNRYLAQKAGDKDQTRPALLATDTVFKLVAEWLLSYSGEEADGIPVHSFTGRRDTANGEILLELLSCSCMLTKTTQSLQEDFGTRRPCDKIVTQHLVVACHMLLLSSFAAVLDALQDDAHAACQAAKAAATTPQRGTGLDDLRVIVVAQLCSYLFVRQCRVVDAYLQVDSGPKPSAGSPDDETDDRKVIQELKAQVDSRVAWFQKL
ncbi:hypothetical protein FBEOM_3869 [Fusarium beomiforme]|uniref:Zn(2)-C6 fungal-type domain-containing protein n=1 Tax=Fusarium beomiforme TaxID=44412 RepID=A0A9P5AP94_9HYPO|nr:hypothetical protein FBEOM_3869 [Fusarium beomiforme]